MPGIILGTGDKVVKLTDKNTTLRSLHPHRKRQINMKKIDKMITDQMAMNTMEKNGAGKG